MAKDRLGSLGKSVERLSDDGEVRLALAAEPKTLGSSNEELDIEELLELFDVLAHRGR